MSNAYKTTSVSVERSKEAIRKLLIDFEVKGIQFSEDFETSMINIKFAKKINEATRTVSVTMRIPEPPVAKRARAQRGIWRNGRMHYSKTATDKKEQMAKATYRALHDWLKAQFVAVEYGLLTFEDIFLSQFEYTLKDGSKTTVGEMIKPRLGLETRTEFLLPSNNTDEDIIDGESIISL